MGRWIRRSGRLVVLGMLGCSASPKALVAIAPPAPPVQPVASAVAAPEETLKDDVIPEPADLAVSVRLGSSARDLPVLGRLLAPPGSDISVLLDHPGLAVKAFLGEAFEGAVDLDQAVDMAFPVDANRGADVVNRFAFALTLKRGEADLAPIHDDFRWTAKGSGQFSLAPAGKGATGRIGEMLECELWPEWRGAAPRLVCASDPALLLSSGAFLARSGARVGSDAAVSAHLTHAGLRAFSPTKPQDEAADRPVNDSGEAGERMGARWVNQYFEDLVTLDAELTLQSGRVDLAIEETSRHASSPLMVMQRAKPGEPERLPDAFWRLPADADLAFFFQGAPPEVMKPIGAQVFHDVVTTIPVDELPASARTEVAGAFSALLLTGGPVLVAYGHDRAAAQDALARVPAEPARKPSRSDDKAYRAARASLQGWTLVHVDEPGSRWSAGLRELVRLGAKHYPKDPSSAAKPAGGATPPAPKKHEPRSHDVTREVPLRPGDGLPSGSLHIVNHSAPNPKYVAPVGADSAPAVEHDLHVFMAPDGETTWIAIAESESIALARLKQEVTRSQPATLADRAGLVSLRAEVGAGAGFITTAGWVSLLLPDAAAKVAEAREDLARARALPFKGGSTIPVLLTSTEEPRAASIGDPLDHVKLSLRLDPEALQEALQWFKQQKSAASSGQTTP